MTIDPQTTALVLIGFQRDYFSPEGVLHGVVEESHRVSGTLDNTLAFIEAYQDSEMLMVNTPIVFSELYEELENPIGVLKMIRDAEAFSLAVQWHPEWNANSDPVSAPIFKAFGRALRGKNFI